jgi:hypothetical protein
VYDMYPWNEPDSASRGDDPPIPPRSREGSPSPSGPLAPLAGDPSPLAPVAGDPSPLAPVAGDPSPLAPVAGDPSSQAPPGRDPSPQASLGGDSSSPTPLVRAVQVALDRRDNGGDAVAVAGQPTTQPTAGRTRQ